MIYRRQAAIRAALSLISLLLVIGAMVPAIARASMLSTILAAIKISRAQADETAQDTGNVQTMALLTPATNLDPSPARGGGDITIVDGSALVPEEGPSGTIADIEKPKNSTISRYVVRPGDSLSSIAKLFDVTPNTVLWANDLSSASQLKVGQELIILPVTGLKYTVKKGDTLASIAKKTGSDATEIANFNGLDGALAAGTEIIIPDGEVPSSTGAKSPRSGVLVKSGVRASGSVIPFANNPREPAHNVGPVGSASQIAYYTAPLTHYIQTQGIHGYNAVDLAAPAGTPILAAADGTVTIAKAGGWNGGYGSYVVITHGNGSQTLYSHMSRVATYDGARVVRGQVIGYVGSTGSSTGPHVHFEIRNGIRNPF